MRLIGFSEARGDDHAAVGEPAAEACAARVLVARQTLGQFGRDRRHVFADAVADLLALHRCRRGRDRGGDDGVRSAGGECENENDDSHGRSTASE